MRVLVVEPGPQFSVADVCRGWATGLAQAGAEVVTLNYADRLNFFSRVRLKHQEKKRYLPVFTDHEAMMMASKGIESACYEFWPDLVLVVSGFYIPPAVYQLMRRRRHKVVLLHLESPYEDVKQMERAAMVDANVINDPTNLDAFRAVNPATWYVPHAYDPQAHCPGPADPDLMSEFCFVGTGYPSRVDFLEAVDWGDIDVALAGNWAHTTEDSPLRKFIAHDAANCCDNADAVRLYRSTKASANIYRTEGDEDAAHGWAMGPREVELAACGTFYLTEERGENREVLPMLPTFSGPADFGEKLRWWLAHESQREAVAVAARAAVTGRTFLANAQQLLRLLDL